MIAYTVGALTMTRDIPLFTINKPVCGTPTYQVMQASGAPLDSIMTFNPTQMTLQIQTNDPTKANVYVLVVKATLNGQTISSN